MTAPLARIVSYLRSPLAQPFSLLALALVSLPFGSLASIAPPIVQRFARFVSWGLAAGETRDARVILGLIALPLAFAFVAAF
jgi:hypothetical protein